MNKKDFKKIIIAFYALSGFFPFLRWGRMDEILKKVYPKYSAMKEIASGNFSALLNQIATNIIPKEINSFTVINPIK
jgi:hypothetical protein